MNTLKACAYKSIDDANVNIIEKDVKRCRWSTFSTEMNINYAMKIEENDLIKNLCKRC